MTWIQLGALGALGPLALAASWLWAPGPASLQDGKKPTQAPAKNSSQADKGNAEFRSYRRKIPGTDVSFSMVAIPAGEFTIGSPESEPGRKADEGPQRKVRIGAFWMGAHEVTWNEYELWQLDLDKLRRSKARAATGLDKKADAVTRPTKPYADMTFGMGQDGYPAICMTQLAAKTYCQWLSAKTGHYYRLPTEAEWEYACRAGTKTAYSFGDDPERLGAYAWYVKNSDEAYHKVGTKKPNPWGLYDMHGNVCEWTLDQYSEKTYASWPADKTIANPLIVPKTLYPRSVRGGSWDDPAPALRSAARRGSNEDWKMQDPQIPKSIWYHTDALFVGFRVVRPLTPPKGKEREKYK